MLKNYYVKLLARAFIVGMTMVIFINIGTFLGMAAVAPFLIFGGIYVGLLVSDMVKL